MAITKKTSNTTAKVVKVKDAKIAKGDGKSVAKRHASKNAPRDDVYGITKPSIRRLARRGGVKRLSGEVYDETRNGLQDFLTKIVSSAIDFTTHSGRLTVRPTDVVASLQKHGHILYGY